MTRAMLFIDGSWLYSNTPKLQESVDESDVRIDFGKLPDVLADTLKSRTNLSNIDLVRTYFFSTYAENYHPADEEAVEKRLNFFSMLRKKYNYEVNVFPVDFEGKRLREEDRDEENWFKPTKKAVDVSFASNLMYNASIPDGFDIAICILGDRNFKPLLERTRDLGKRIAVASIKNGCSPELTDVSEPPRTIDFSPIWLENHISDIKLVYDRHQLTCESPMHEGDPEVWTTYHPQEGEKFYCDECREKYKRKQNDQEDEEVHSTASDAEQDHGETTPDYDVPSSGNDGFEGQNMSMEPDNNTPPPGNAKSDYAAEKNGFVKKKFPDRGYGFIQAEDGSDYFFHLSDLMFDLTFDDITEGKNVDFIIKKEGSRDEAGAATNVRLGEPS